MNESVIHNIGDKRFEILLEDGSLAYLEYIPTDAGWIFAHTIVPKAFEGRGLAAAMVKSGLEYALANHLTVIPSCSYVAAYLQRHPEYRILLEKG